MLDHPIVLVDRERVGLFSCLEDIKSLFTSAVVYHDNGGVPWKRVRLGDTAIGITPLGPAAIWHKQVRNETEDEVQQRITKLRNANAVQLGAEFKRVMDGLRMGSIAERALWCIHQSVLESGTSLMTIADTKIKAAIWGTHAIPRHWRTVIREVMRGLQYLHVADWSDDPGTCHFGSDSGLILHFGDLRGDPLDKCDDVCRSRNPGPHHHFQVEIGPGFLGVLERLGKLADDGSRSYQFNKKPRKGKNLVTLNSTGKSNRLVSVYLPARIGEPQACKKLSSEQRGLLQAFYREGTRAAKDAATDAGPFEVSDGDRIRNFSGKDPTSCPYLDEEGAHVGFNGNVKRKGLGYKLRSPGGWLVKAGYAVDRIADFLDDLGELAEMLGLIVVGINRDQAWFDLKKLKQLAASPVGLITLDRVHVRIHAKADFLCRWNQFFGWHSGAEVRTETPIARVTELAHKLKEHNISIRRFAKECLHKHHTYVLRLFKQDETRWPAGLLQTGHDWVDHQPLVSAGICTGGKRGNHKHQEPDTRPTVEVAVDYLKRGWTVIPQQRGAKCPCIKWKQFQDRLPTKDEVCDWFARWPKAGIALVLGPVSNVFVIDVDGREAHEALLDHLHGKEPVAVKALSGSHEPYRYHLYFQHPDLPTKAKATPWHPKLEFRGHGGILVMPPSIHKSGKAYVWSDGRSPDDLELPTLPVEILKSLKPKTTPPTPKTANMLKQSINLTGIDASASTLLFLKGKHAEGPGWNGKLFQAACDLHGRGLSRKKAEPLLLAGACPWNQGELESAMRTISSAYAAPRAAGLK